MLKLICVTGVLLLLSPLSRAVEKENGKKAASCSGIMANAPVRDPNFRPNDAISRKFVAGGLRYFLLEVPQSELKRFLSELTQLDSTSIPASSLTQKDALIPITKNFNRQWLQTPTFAKMTPLKESEISQQKQGVPVQALISPSRSVYVIVDPRVLNTRPWAVYNDLSLRNGGEGNIYDEINPKSGYAEMQDSAQDMSEMQARNQMYRGRFVLDGTILKTHVLGFLVQPDEPELSEPLKQVATHLMDDRLVVLETNDLGAATAYLENPESRPRIAEGALFRLTNPWPPKPSSLFNR